MKAPEPPPVIRYAVPTRGADQLTRCVHCTVILRLTRIGWVHADTAALLCEVTS